MTIKPRWDEYCVGFDKIVQMPSIRELLRVFDSQRSGQSTKLRGRKVACTTFLYTRNYRETVSIEFKVLPTSIAIPGIPRKIPRSLAAILSPCCPSLTDGCTPGLQVCIRLHQPDYKAC